MVATKVQSVPMYSEGVIGDAVIDMSTQCINCVHRIAGTVTCLAFEEGVPSEILGGGFDHKKEFEGDNGIRYKKRKKKDRLLRFVETMPEATTTVKGKKRKG